MVPERRQKEYTGSIRGTGNHSPDPDSHIMTALGPEIDNLNIVGKRGITLIEERYVAFDNV